MPAIYWYTRVGEVSDLVDHTEGTILGDLILSYLGTDDKTKIRLDYDLFKDEPNYDPDEVWSIGDDFECLLTLDEVHSSTFTWGCVKFGLYKGRKIVLEQCASPLMPYWVEIDGDPTD